MKVFYVTTLVDSRRIDDARVDVAKFFARENAEDHAARLNGGMPRVEEREESVEAQDPAHRYAGLEGALRRLDEVVDGVEH